MLVQDLIKTINIFNVNVEYDSSEHCKKRILNGDSAVYFAVANDEEQRKYQIKNCTDMKSITATIHVPNLSVRELVNIYECDGTGLFDLTNEMISKFYNESISNDIIFSIFSFLHEVGHWMQFEKIDRNIYEYINMDLSLEIENFNKVKALHKQREDRIKKGNSCRMTAKEKRMFREYMIEYRNIPKEKDADEFALNNMEICLRLLNN